MVDLFGHIHIDWLGKRKIFFAITIFLILIGGVSLATKGKFRYGVDFKGGTLVKVLFKQTPDVAQIRAALPSDATVQANVNVPNEFLIEYEKRFELNASQSGEVITKALNVKVLRDSSRFGVRISSERRSVPISGSRRCSPRFMRFGRHSCIHRLPIRMDLRCGGGFCGVSRYIDHVGSFFTV